MPNELTREETVRLISSVFPNATRRKIIKLLLGESEGETTQMYHNEIFDRLRGSKSTIHRHLTELEILGILKSKPGYKSSSDDRLVKYYSITPKYLEAMIRYRDLL